MSFLSCNLFCYNNCLCVLNIIVLAGDFNIDLLSHSNIKSQYCNILTDFHLTQHIKELSRVYDLSSTLIDHVITSNSLTVSNTIQAPRLSDHRVQLAHINIPVQDCSSRVLWIRSFRKCDWEQLKEMLCHAPWQVMSTFDEIDDKWDFFMVYYSKLLILFYHLRKLFLKNLKRPTPWFTDAIADKIKQIMLLSERPRNLMILLTRNSSQDKKMSSRLWYDKPR